MSASITFTDDEIRDFLGRERVLYDFLGPGADDAVVELDEAFPAAPSFLDKVYRAAHD